MKSRSNESEDIDKFYVWVGVFGSRVSVNIFKHPVLLNGGSGKIILQYKLILVNIQ